MGKYVDSLIKENKTLNKKWVKFRDENMELREYIGELRRENKKLKYENERLLEFKNKNLAKVNLVNMFNSDNFLSLSTLGDTE